MPKAKRNFLTDVGDLLHEARLATQVFSENLGHSVLTPQPTNSTDHILVLPGWLAGANMQLYNLVEQDLRREGQVVLHSPVPYMNTNIGHLLRTITQMQRPAWMERLLGGVLDEATIFLLLRKFMGGDPKDFFIILDELEEFALQRNVTGIFGHSLGGLWGALLAARLGIRGAFVGSPFWGTPNKILWRLVKEAVNLGASKRLVRMRRQAIAHIDQRVLVVVGRDDRLAPVDSCRLPGAKLSIRAGGHVTVLTQSHTTRLIARHLAGENVVARIAA